MSENAKNFADHRSLPSHREDPPRPYACSTYDAAIYLGLLSEGADPDSKAGRSATRTVRDLLRTGRLYGYYTGRRDIWIEARRLHGVTDEMERAA